MHRRFLVAFLILAATALALACRLGDLDLRVLHGDEAVNALKFRDLFDRGHYVFDPHQYHGPSLYYLTLPFAWGATHWGDAKNWADLGPADYRLVAAACGSALVPLLLLVPRAIGRTAAVCAAILTAISPAMVFYSRYYIHEMPMVLFTFVVMAAGWRYLHAESRRARLGWAVVCGAGAGLMHATKETCYLSFFAVAAAWFCSEAWARLVHRRKEPFRLPIAPRDALAGAAAAVLVSAALYTSLFTHPRGLFDAFSIFTHYAGRAVERRHTHEWNYYLKMLTWWRVAAGPVWSEGLIFGLALVGAAACLSRVGVPPLYVPLSRLLVFYTLLLTVIYSAIPYKTPWNLLAPLHAMILLAGVGAAALLKVVPKGVSGGITAAVRLAMRLATPSRRRDARDELAGLRMGLALLLTLLTAAALLAPTMQLRDQMRRTNSVFYADERNPYVYGHSSSDLLRLVAMAETLARLSPEGYHLPILIAADNYWPLPWYLRRFDRAGYWDKPVPPEFLQADAPLVAVMSELDEATDVNARGHLHDDARYWPFSFGLRPQVILNTYLRMDLWPAYKAERNKAARTPPPRP